MHLSQAQPTPGKMNVQLLFRATVRANTASVRTYTAEYSLAEYVESFAADERFALDAAAKIRRTDPDGTTTEIVNMNATALAVLEDRA